MALRGRAAFVRSDVAVRALAFTSVFWRSNLTPVWLFLFLCHTTSSEDCESQHENDT